MVISVVSTLLIVWLMTLGSGKPERKPRKEHVTVSTQQSPTPSPEASED
jgi:hypothetical protein